MEARSIPPDSKSLNYGAREWLPTKAPVVPRIIVKSSLFGATETAPTAPTSLSAVCGPAWSATGRDVTLTWTDTSSNEQCFEIQRSLTNIDANFVTIAAVIKNVVTFIDKNLSQTTLYYFRVRARNSGGDSAWSNVASVTTNNKKIAVCTYLKVGLGSPPAGGPIQAYSDAYDDYTSVTNGAKTVVKLPSVLNTTTLGSENGFPLTPYLNLTPSGAGGQTSTAYYSKISDPKVNMKVKITAITADFTLASQTWASLSGLTYGNSIERVYSLVVLDNIGSDVNQTCQITDQVSSYASLTLAMPSGTSIYGFLFECKHYVDVLTFYTGGTAVFNCGGPPIAEIYGDYSLI